jgi:hypothetical protein
VRLVFFGVPNQKRPIRKFLESKRRSLFELIERALERLVDHYDPSRAVLLQQTRPLSMKGRNVIG